MTWSTATSVVSNAADFTAAESKPPHWLTDYAEAMKQAELQERMLLIYFRGTGDNVYRDQFEHESLVDPKIREKLTNFVLCRLPLDAQISAEGKPMQLLNHAAYAELKNREGLAIVDLKNRDTEHYGYVVNVFPLVPGKYYRYQPHHLAVILDLPPGTLTQRTMVFAVRIHPEAPASTTGEFCPVLSEEARNHSHYQAQIRVQGHHHWGWRFERVLSRLRPFGGSLRPQEVVAESWPHEDVVDAAVDCVDCWRQSSGHWSAVRANQPRYGYDMRRSPNGIWYATGLFGNRN